MAKKHINFGGSGGTTQDEEIVEELDGDQNPAARGKLNATHIEGEDDEDQTESMVGSLN